MRKILSLSPVLVLCSALCFQACGQKDKKQPGTNELIEKNKALIAIAIPASKGPGLGASKGIPSGTKFTLPPCVRIVERPNHPFDPDIKKLHGSMNTFYTDVSVVNECSDPVTIEFPAGLVAISIHEGTQNGILVRREFVTIPPRSRIGGGGNNDTTTIYLGMACLNEHRGLPWEENSEEDTRDYAIGKGMHTLGPVTDDKSLQQLLALLANKPQLKVKQHYNPQDAFDPDSENQLPADMEIYNTIQKAIWKVTDGQGITKGELEKLKGELKKYE